MTHRSTFEQTPDAEPEQVLAGPDEGSFGSWGHDEHVHDDGALVYAFAGSCVLTARGVAYPVAENRAVWLPPQTPHSARFAPGFAPLLIETGTERWHPSPLALTVSTELRHDLLAAQLGAADPGNVVVGELVRLLARPDLGALSTANAAGPLTGPITTALTADPADQRTLDEWARELHAGTASIRRAFREETGIGFSEWRTRCRLVAALDLLESGHAVSVVATRVGLTHHGLVAAFHRHLGSPPSAYGPTSSQRQRS